MKEITLCGAHHLDVGGPERLKKLLEKIRPSVISLECFQSDIDKMVAFHKKVVRSEKEIKDGKTSLGVFKEKEMKYIDKESLFLLLYAFYFEIWVSKQYAEENEGVEIIAVEDPRMSDQKIKERGLGQEIKDVSLSMAIMSPEKMKKFSNHQYFHGLLSEKEKGDLMLAERDKHVFGKLVKINDGKILHLGGVVHMYGNYENLYEMLWREFGRVVGRMKLIEVDYWER